MTHAARHQTHAPAPRSTAAQAVRKMRERAQGPGGAAKPLVRGVSGTRVWRLSGPLRPSVSERDERGRFPEGAETPARGYR